MLWMDHTSCGELAPEEAQPVSAPNHLDRASGSLNHQVPTLNTTTNIPSHTTTEGTIQKGKSSQ